MRVGQLVHARYRATVSRSMRETLAREGTACNGKTPGAEDVEPARHATYDGSFIGCLSRRGAGMVTRRFVLCGQGRSCCF